MERFVFNSSLVSLADIFPVHDRYKPSASRVGKRLSPGASRQTMINARDPATTFLKSLQCDAPTQNPYPQGCLVRSDEVFPGYYAPYARRASQLRSSLAWEYPKENLESIGLLAGRLGQPLLHDTPSSDSPILAGIELEGKWRIDCGILLPSTHGFESSGRVIPRHRNTFKGRYWFGIQVGQDTDRHTECNGGIPTVAKSKRRSIKIWLEACPAGPRSRRA